MSNKSGMLKLLQATDSLFPIGAFTLSNGMETYTNLGIVNSGESLSEYLAALQRSGLCRKDCRRRGYYAFGRYFRRFALPI